MLYNTFKDKKLSGLGLGCMRLPTVGGEYGKIDMDAASAMVQYAMEQGEVIILRNGKRVARIISEEATVGYLTDSLRGVLKQQYSDDDVKAARTAKYDL